MIVYLCGHMSEADETRDWREEAARKLSALRIQSLNPFRGKQSLSEGGVRCSHPTSILTARDKADIKRCDAMILNALGMEKWSRQSIGTWSEFGYCALGLEKPVIVIATLDSVRRHPFIEQWSTQTVDTLDEAIAAVAWLR